MAARPDAQKAGPGIDMVEIDRIERALARHPGLRERLFRPSELDYADARARPARHLAARFAAKEAAKKALADPAIALRDVEVVGSAPPSIRLHGRAARAAEQAQAELAVSLTHTRELAAAVVTPLRSARSAKRG